MRTSCGVLVLILSGVMAGCEVPSTVKEVDLSCASVASEREAMTDCAQSIVDQMSIEQKVAQMIQPEIRDITVEDMRRYGFGSYLNGGGAFPNNNKHATPADWIQLAEDMYQASVDDSLDGSSIPTMWGTDAVHGHNNVIGATLFPHNIGLGAANNPELIKYFQKQIIKKKEEFFYTEHNYNIPEFIDAFKL